MRKKWLITFNQFIAVAQFGFKLIISLGKHNFVSAKVARNIPNLTGIVTVRRNKRFSFMNFSCFWIYTVEMCKSLLEFFYSMWFSLQNTTKIFPKRPFWTLSFRTIGLWFSFFYVFLFSGFFLLLKLFIKKTPFVGKFMPIFVSIWRATS